MGPERVTVPIRLEPGASSPSYATEGSAGCDIRCIEDVNLMPGERRLVPTGIRIEVPVGYEAQVRPRSGLAVKYGLSMVNTPGTIDSDYRGELKILLINLGQEPVHLQAQERIAQLVIARHVVAEFVPCQEATASARGEGGFGSTGTQ